MVASGFVGESKFEILKQLPSGDESMLRFGLIRECSAVERVEAADEFMKREGLSFPVVLKPDAGQRGSGVAVIRREEELTEYLTRTSYDTIIQEYAPGKEFGVFYYRHPSEAARAHLFDYRKAASGVDWGWKAYIGAIDIEG